MDSHVWTKFIEVPIAILLHFVWRVDGQGPVGVHGDHHAANICLGGREEKGNSVNPHCILSVSNKSTGFNFSSPLSILLLIVKHRWE